LLSFFSFRLALLPPTSTTYRRSRGQGRRRRLLHQPPAPALQLGKKGSAPAPEWEERVCGSKQAGCMGTSRGNVGASKGGVWA
ncbi:unnamed protein product, partial [Closterium sp. NIES-64]